MWQSCGVPAPRPSQPERMTYDPLSSTHNLAWPQGDGSRCWDLPCSGSQISTRCPLAGWHRVERPVTHAWLAGSGTHLHSTLLSRKLSGLAHSSNPAATPLTTNTDDGFEGSNLTPGAAISLGRNRKNRPPIEWRIDEADRWRPESPLCHSIPADDPPSPRPIPCLQTAHHSWFYCYTVV